MPAPMRMPLARLESAAMNGVLAKAGRVLLAMRGGASRRSDLQAAAGASPEEMDSLLDALTGLHYVTATDGVYSLQIPVLSRDDAAMVKAVREESARVMTAWLQQQ